MPKITELDALTSITSDDLTYFVDAPGTAPVGKKVAFSTLKSAVLNYSNTVVVALSGADYTSIQTAYTYAKTLSPSATNRILIKIMPGRYTEQLVMDTNYIDLAGEGICTADIYTNSTGYTILKSCTYANIFGMKISAGASASGAFHETVGTSITGFIQSCYFTSAANMTINNTGGSWFDCTIENTSAGGNYAIINNSGYLFSCNVLYISGRGIETNNTTGVIEGCIIRCVNYAMISNNGKVFSSKFFVENTCCIYGVGSGEFISCHFMNDGSGSTITNASGLKLNGCILEHRNSVAPAILLDGTGTSVIYNTQVISPNYTTCWLKQSSGSPTVRLSNNVCKDAPIDPTNLTIINESPQLGGDADGDLYYRNSGALQRLPKGLAGRSLKMNAGATIPEWTDYSNVVTVALSGGQHTSIQTAYTYAKTLSPSATNRILVKVMPGRYTEQLVMDTDYIDLAGDGICTAEIYSNVSGYTVTKSCHYTNIFGMKISCGASATGVFDEADGSHYDSFIQSCHFISPVRLTINTLLCTAFDCTFENTKLSNGSAINTLLGCLYSCQIIARDGYGIENITGVLATVENCVIDCGSYATSNVSNGKILSTILRSAGICIYGRGTYIGCHLESVGNSYVVESGGGNLKMLGCFLGSGGTTKPAVILDGTSTSIIENCTIETIYATCWLKAGTGSPTVRLSNNVSYYDTGSGVVTVPIDPTNITIINESPQLGGDADGDLYVRSGGALTRIAKGTALQDFRMNSGATLPGWENPYNNQVNYEVLSGTKTIADGDPAIQILSCTETYSGGADYTVNLPTTPVKSTRFFIRNDTVNTQNGRSLFITVNSVVISTLKTGGFGDFYWTSSGWRNQSPGGIDGVVTTTKQGIAIGEKAMTKGQTAGEIAIGYNSLSRVSSVSIGQNTVSQGNGSIAIGSSASADGGNGTTIALGGSTVSTGYGAVALGTYAKAPRRGEVSFSGDYSTNNKHPFSNFRWMSETVAANTTNVVLLLHGVADNRLTLIANSTLGFELHFVGRDTVTANRGYYAIVKGAIERNGSNATSLIGTTTIEEVTKTAGITWTVDAIADDTNDALVPVILTTDPTNITAWTVTGFITTVSA